MEEGNYDELVDPRLENNYAPHEMARMVACAATSIRHSAKRRPKMSQVGIDVCYIILSLLNYYTERGKMDGVFFGNRLFVPWKVMSRWTT